MYETLQINGELDHINWNHQAAATRGGLSRLEVERYGRQVVLPSFGPEGQKKLLEGGECLWISPWISMDFVCGCL